MKSDKEEIKRLVKKSHELFPRAGFSKSDKGYSVKGQRKKQEPEKKGLIGQPLHILSREWRDDLERYDQEMRAIEEKLFGNKDIKENGIHRKIISTEDMDLKKDLNRIAKCQPFAPDFCRALFSEIHMVFMGDSLVRGMYKDLIVLLRTNNGELSPDEKIKNRLESAWYGDRLLDFADPDEKTEYMEFREYLREEHWIQYVFTTRIYNDKVEQLLAQFKQNPPDVVVIHSNIWDSTRYSNDDRISLTQFALRLSYLCQRLKEILEPTAVVIFVILPPAAYDQATERSVKRGFFSYFIEQRMLQMNKISPFISSTANYFAAQIVSSYGFDVLDMNFHFQDTMFAALRCSDGLHYSTLGIRIMNQALIGHLIKAWEVDLPEDVGERLEKLQLDYFQNSPEELENLENEHDSDFMEDLPACYRWFFQTSKDLYEKLEAENSSVSQVIKECREKLLRKMENFVRDPYLKRYILDLTSLPNDEIEELKPIIVNVDDENDERHKKFSEQEQQFFKSCITPPEILNEIFDDIFASSSKRLGINFSEEKQQHFINKKIPEDAESLAHYLLENYYKKK